MASVFKRGKKYYARFKESDGNWQKELGFTDKTATMQLATKREHEASLVSKGLMEAPKAKDERPIADDLKEFRSSLTNKDVSDFHEYVVVRRCELLCAGCGFDKVGDIDATTVDGWLAKQRRGDKNAKSKKKKKGMSVQTSNHYLRAIKQFSRWLHRGKRLREDPLIHLEMLNVAVDRRHDRLQPAVFSVATPDTPPGSWPVAPGSACRPGRWSRRGFSVRPRASRRRDRTPRAGPA